MVHVKLRLTGCSRYNFKGELYESGKVYLVGEVKAKLMLRKEDENGKKYFTPYVKPSQSRSERAAQAAAIAAKAAIEAVEREEADIVVREDGSEFVAGSEEDVTVDDPDAAVEVEVDKDDDETLDEDGPVNSEEVDVAEDRDDGTAVEV